MIAGTSADELGQIETDPALGHLVSITLPVKRRQEGVLTFCPIQLEGGDEGRRIDGNADIGRGENLHISDEAEATDNGFARGDVEFGQIVVGIDNESPIFLGRQFPRSGFLEITDQDGATIDIGSNSPRPYQDENTEQDQPQWKAKRANVDVKQIADQQQDAVINCSDFLSPVPVTVQVLTT